MHERIQFLMHVLDFDLVLVRVLVLVLVPVLVPVYREADVDQLDMGS